MNKKIVKLIIFVLILSGVFKGSFVYSAVKHGVYKAFYSDGSLRMKTKYKDGSLIYKKIYYKNGKLSKYYVYKGRKRIKTKTYYENGQLQSAWTEKSGESKYYSKNGTLKAVVKDNPTKELIERLPAALL